MLEKIVILSAVALWTVIALLAAGGPLLYVILK